MAERPSVKKNGKKSVLFQRSESQAVTRIVSPISSQHTVAVHFLRLLTDYASRFGLAPETLLARGGIKLDLLNDPNGRVPFSDFSRLCEIASEILGDPGLGLKLGKSVRPGHLGSHGFALMSCSTGLELMHQSLRYSALAIDAAHNTLERRGDECIRYWRSNLPGDAPLGRIQDEIGQAIWITLARWYSNREDLNPNWVSFRHPEPSYARDYEAVFRSPVHFDTPDNAIGFDASILDMPLPHANAQLRRIMTDLCEQLVKHLGNSLEPAWLAIARRMVLESFKRGVPDISEVATSVGVTEVEFKEMLSQRGLSFRGFVDELRRALACGYTRDPTLSLVDIAYLLGFSEQSAFQRAFKRWTGMTPGEYRRNPCPAAPPLPDSNPLPHRPA